MASSSRRSSGPVLPISSAFQRSISPSGRFSSSAAATTAFASSSSSSFSTRPASSFFHRSASPTRVNLVPSPSPSSSVRFSLSHHHHHHHHRSTSPGRSLSVADQIPSHRPVAGGGSSAGPPPGRRTCMCSPTTHPGSFRCSLHKGFHSSSGGVGGPHRPSSHAAASSPSYRLNARRSAMTNSLVRIGTVEGDLVKRALAALIRPSSHHQRRRSAFQPRPSRLSVMSKADDPDL